MLAAIVSAGLGWSLIVLGFLRFVGIQVPSEFMVGFSLSAMLFSIADFLQFLSDFEKTENEQKSEKMLDWSLKMSMSAVACMILIPLSGILSKIPQSISDILSDATSLIGLGTVITLISVKSSSQMGDEKKALKNEVEQLRAKIEELTMAQDQVAVSKKPDAEEGDQ